MKNSMISLMVAFICCAAFISSSFATVHVVNNAGPGDFPSVTAAVTAAAAGDTLYLVGSPTSYGNITLTKRLTLIGPGYFLEQNPNTNQNKMRAIIGYLYLQPALPLAEPTRDFNSGAAGSHIMGLQFDNEVRVYVNNVIIERCHAHSVMGQVFGGQYPSNVTVSRCIIQFYVQNMEASLIQNSMISYQGSYESLTNVRNSIVKNCKIYSAPASDNPNTAFRNMIMNTVTVLSGQSPENVKFCVFTVANGAGYSPGIGNIFSASNTTMYITPAPAALDASYQLGASSAALNAGRLDDDTTPTDAGPFGGLTPYVLSGLPSLPIVYEITAPNAVNAADGLPVTIKVKANN